MSDLDDEAARTTALLEGKCVRHVWRRRAGEVGLEFTDGTRLFVNAIGSGVELSVTGGRPRGQAGPAD